MSRKLLQRVIEEGHRGFAIKSVFGGGETVEQWSIPVELKADIEKHLARASERRKAGRPPIKTKKGQAKMDMVYDHIVDYIKENKYPPSIREIRFDCEISSTSVVNYYLEKLEDEGLIERTPYVARGITVT
jgi:predicted MarR family transcription regulator